MIRSFQFPGPSPRHRENKLLEYVGKAVDVLRQQNGIICATHPNANIYTMLSSLVEFDGFYLESDPCLVCNNPEVPFAVSLFAICINLVRASRWIRVTIDEE